MAKKKDLGELAKEWNKPIDELLRVARFALGKDGLNEHHSVTVTQSNEIREKWDVAVAATNASLKTQPPLQARQPIGSDFVPATDDRRPEFASLRFPELGYKIWCHQDVYEQLQVHKQLSKRATMALRQIVAFGHPSVAKGCSDEANRGWLRSPLGGGSQNHYYLWWTRQGSPALKNFPAGKDDIVVRSVRHHDEHSPLDADNLQDYLSVEREKLGDAASEFDSPWNPEQLSFIESEEPVRLAVGRPGSGKTTVLWQAVYLRSDQDVLYVTWSRKLVAEAEKHFQAFAPTGTQILALDFPQFLGKICGQDLSRKSLQATREIFEEALPKNRPNKFYGPWVNKTDALFAEIRAHLVGSIKLSDVNRINDNIPLQSILKSYSQDERVLKRIGGPAVDALCNIVSEIEEVQPVVSLFSELDASARATTILKNGNFPERFKTITRIVVDEIQDLTLVELNVFLELSKAIRQLSGRLPFILLAGDEGQTVRPSGFEWGPTSDLIRNTIKKNPESFQLQASVRYPGRIAGVLERASSLYGAVNKADRPGKQSRVSSDDYRQAQLLHVEITDRKKGIDLLRKLVQLDGVLLVTAGAVIPSWIKGDVGEGVLSPLESKGLEFQSVCVINPGVELVEIGTASQHSGNRLENLHRRTRIDQLRVAMSRATETLVFIDIEATDQALKSSKDLLDGPASFDATDLVDVLILADKTPEERVLTRIDAAQVLLEAKPARALQLVEQALELLGEPGLHNGVTEPDLRKRTVEVALAITSTLLVNGSPEGLTYENIRNVANSALDILQSKECSEAFDSFADWTQKHNQHPFEMLDAIAKVSREHNWHLMALSTKSNQLLKEVRDGASNLSTAWRFEGNVESWIEMCGESGDIQSKSKILRSNAVDTLLENGKGHFAEDVLLKIDNILRSTDIDDQKRIGRLRISQGRWGEAAKAFELGKSHRDAVKAWRQAGMWNDAKRAAEEGEIDDPDLDWLLKFEGMVSAMPSGLPDRLHDKERTRTAELRRRL